MYKKLIMLLFVLAFVGSASAANMYWTGGQSQLWSNADNWGGTGTVPTSADWVDIRQDAWVSQFPVVTSGVTATTGVIRINPGYGVSRVARIIVSGGTLNAHGQMYIGNSGVGGGLFVLNSGAVTIGITENAWTMVGAEGTQGTLRIEGGTFNSGTLGIPQWWGTAGTGHVYIAGGVLNTTGVIIGGSPNAIQFTSNSSGAGDARLVDVQDLNDTDFDGWQATINALVAANQIFSDVGDITVSYSSLMETRTTEIYSTIPEPMSIALLGFGGLLLRRRRRN